MRSRALFIGREQPSEERALAEGRKEAGRDSRSNEALDAVRAGDPLAAAAHIREAGERGALSPPVDEGRVGRRPEYPLAILLGQHEQPILLGERQRPEQHSVHDTENGGVGADGEGQGQDRRRREPGTPAEGPHGVAEVGEEGVDHSYLRAFPGSTRLAIRAGRKLAMSATRASTPAAPAYETGSRAPTP